MSALADKRKHVSIFELETQFRSCCSCYTCYGTVPPNTCQDQYARLPSQAIFVPARFWKRLEPLLLFLSARNIMPVVERPVVRVICVCCSYEYVVLVGNRRFCSIFGGGNGLCSASTQRLFIDRRIPSLLVLISTRYTCICFPFLPKIKCVLSWPAPQTKHKETFTWYYLAPGIIMVLLWYLPG